MIAQKTANWARGANPIRTTSNHSWIPRTFFNRRCLSTTSTLFLKMLEFGHADRTERDEYIDRLSFGEAMYRNGPRGYCAIRPGECLDGRYKALCKIAHGGFSTVWAARDQTNGKYVVLKVSVRTHDDPRERDILRTLAANTSQHPGSGHLVRLHDSFVIQGRYGLHQCLVLDLLGERLQSTGGMRLPGKTAKRIAKEVLLGLDYLHSQDITHGDLHTANVTFAMPSLDHLSEEDFCIILGKTETEANKYKPKPPPIPKRSICASSVPKIYFPVSQAMQVKIVDFGGAFRGPDDAPETVHVPQYLMPPESIFGERLDHRFDMWSMGCLLFELVTGHPPFNTWGDVTPTNYMRDVLHLVPQAMPTRWQPKWRELESAEAPHELGEHTLQTWLKKLYVGNLGVRDLSRKDLRKVGELVRRMLRLEPAERATAAEILDHAWFRDV
ncbi:kinase-like domain-containing protein [Phyllosticta capitalensis]|uniref:Kinase-like domain-containing protein n=1 Tax=Phyllosticta capitalensis TaxID=121624 RepID=A0ABR1YHD6_9PEZI